MSIKSNELKVGEKYSLGDVDNIFEVIAEHNTYHWIEWVDNGELETAYFERHDLKAINPININMNKTTK
tara:strand:- start:77 stop:283 length:207 start_codon:yes stop_codon:yes gene_type:complete